MKDMQLKIRYDLPDLLSWSYHANRAVFDGLIPMLPLEFIKKEIGSYFFHEAYKQEILNACGIEYEIPPGEQERSDFCMECVAEMCHASLDDATMAWLTDRGVTPTQIVRHKIGSTAEYNPLKAMLRWGKDHRWFYPPLIGIPAVMEHYGKSKMTMATFPFRDASGKFTNLCLRVTDNDYTEIFKFFFSHGRTSLFNMDKIDLTRPFLVAEGVFDVLTAERFDLPAVGLGCSSLSSAQIDALMPYKKNAVLCLDGDIAGRYGMTCTGNSFRKIFLPRGNDLDDILRKDPSYAKIIWKDLRAG